MKSFSLKLDNTIYECSCSQSSKEGQNWTIQAIVYGMRVSISIPIESKLTTIQVMAFIERFHEGMLKAKEEQKTSIDYTS